MLWGSPDPAYGRPVSDHHPTLCRATPLRETIRPYKVATSTNSNTPIYGTSSQPRLGNTHHAKYSDKEYIRKIHIQHHPRICIRIHTRNPIIFKTLIKSPARKTKPSTSPIRIVSVRFRIRHKRSSLFAKRQSHSYRKSKVKRNYPYFMNSNQRGSPSTRAETG